MSPFPKPRGFWDYALFALVMTGLLLFLFWIEASDEVDWADAALAFTVGVLIVLVIVLVRRKEKGTWIVQPPRYTLLLAVLAATGLLFGAIFADAYLFHRKDITTGRLRHDMVIGVGMMAVVYWSLRKRSPAKRVLL
jgi:hypothetical protein